MIAGEPGLGGHPDRRRWNEKYAARPAPSFAPHPLAVRALALGPPAGPVLDLACGPSGSVLAAAAAGRLCTAVDASDVALGMLAGEAARRGLSGLVRLVQADLARWRPEPDRYALVLCTGYWDAALFPAAARAVLPGGLLGWEAFTRAALRSRPSMPARWCLAPGEPAGLLPPGYAVLTCDDLPDAAGARRRLLARRGRRALGPEAQEGS